MCISAFVRGIDMCVVVIVVVVGGGGGVVRWCLVFTACALLWLPSRTRLPATHLPRTYNEIKSTYLLELMYDWCWQWRSSTNIPECILCILFIYKPRRERRGRHYECKPQTPRGYILRVLSRTISSCKIVHESEPTLWDAWVYFSSLLAR